MDQQTQPVYEFLGFQLDVGQRVLIRDGNLIALTPKAFDVLLFLIQNRGRVLEKDELMKAIWPESFVEEGNLSQNIFVLRKILADSQNGDSVIQTIPRRGYKFVASVKELDITSNAKGSVDSVLSAEYWSEHSPFRGLQIFELEDAWLFFGRDTETEDLLFRLDRSPVLAVIGNSGCGKSSLIRAGLIPALRAGKFRHGETPIDFWRVAIVRPSEAPFDYLAEVLPTQLAPEMSLREQVDFVADCRSKLPMGGETLRNAISVLANATIHESRHARILLVIDQFEELFTLTTKHDVRERYIDALLAAGRWDSSIPIHVLLLLRADFYSHCLEHPGLSRCLEMNLYNVPRMTHDQLRETVEKRLALAGAHAEPGLIDSLLDDVGAEPGDLALLEHALTQLWEKCGGYGCTLTNTAYSAIGRLRGALSAHADEVCGRITDDDQRHLAQKIFLELVHLGERAPDTRRRVRKQELLSLGVPEEVEPLLARLTASRLITMGGEGEETFAEVSHEALIREWFTLREWITQNREELQLERRLGQAAQEWESLNRDTGALLQGARLAQGEDWLVRHPMAPAPVRDFLQASVSAHADAEARELHKQKIAGTRLRWFSCVLAGLLLVALFMTWFARRQQVLAEARALAAQSEEMLSRDQGGALDVAIRGWDIAQTSETKIALTKVWPQSLSMLKDDAAIEVAVFSPNGEHILTTSFDHTARVWNSADGRLLLTLQGHTDAVVAASFSLDGQRIVTASLDHTARVWNSADGRLLFTLQGHTAKVENAVFSPDGKRILTTSWNHTARVWNSSDGRLLLTLQGHTDAVVAASFSPDGQRIVTASLDHTARVWNAADGRLLAILQGHTDRVWGASFSPDGQRILTASADHTARVWNAADGRLLAILQGHTDAVWGAKSPVDAKFSPDGQRIVATSGGNTARIWNTSDGHLLITLHHEHILRAVFSPDGQFVVTAGGDNTARLWTIDNGQLLATLQGHTSFILQVSFSPDGRRILTSSNDHTARIWNLAASRLLATVHEEPVAFSRDGQHVVTHIDHTVRLWNTSARRLRIFSEERTDAVGAPAFSSDGQRLVTASSDHTARVWNTADGHLLFTLLGHTDIIQHLAFSPDGQSLVTASSDHTARVWNTADGRLLATLRGHTGKVLEAEFSPDGQHIVTASDDNTARVWNTADGRLLATLRGHTDEVARAEFSPDGQYIITASDDRTARVWNTADGRLLATLQGHTGPVWGAEFSPDGQRIITTSWDCTARVWNTADGRLLTTLQGHTGPVWGAEFSPDGQRIVTASLDRTARVWNTADGRLLETLQGHTGLVLGAEFSRDGQRIITTNSDNTMRIWQVLTLNDIKKILMQ